MSETWRAIPGCDGYEVSDQGRVRSWRRKHGAETPHVLSGGSLKDGRPMVCLQTPLGQRSRPVHLLVALAFLGPRPERALSTGRIEVCHNDGDLMNNAASNLRYDTSKSNVGDAIDLSTQVSVRNTAKTHCPSGHEYDEANTSTSLTGSGHLSRHCRKCAVERNRRYRARLKASA